MLTEAESLGVDGEGKSGMSRGIAGRRFGHLNSRLMHRLTWVAVVMMCCVPVNVARANPMGGNVVAGSANISQSGPTTTVHQSSNRSVINWQQFSIGAGETTRFVLPSSSAAVLNRVTGNNPSAILGTLQSNGNVYLINPNGILVGAGAQINVGSFTASTLNVSNDEFMKGGALNFFGNSKASVENYGSITATSGNIFLIGAHVANGGLLSAANGTVGLIAGQDVRLVDSMNPAIEVRPTAASLGGTGVLNTGTINSLQSALVANGGNVYGLAINNTGTIRATGSEVRGGRIVLVARGGNIESSGTLIAKKGQNGGEVLLDAGDTGTVKLAGYVDVSGDEGGSVRFRGGVVDITKASFNVSGSPIGSVAALIGSHTITIHPPTVNVPGNPDENVQFNGGLTSTGTTVMGDTNMSGSVIDFTSNNGETLTFPSMGQARVEEQNGNAFSGLMITPNDSNQVFTDVEFNIGTTGLMGPPTSTAKVIVEGLDSNGNPLPPTMLMFTIDQGANKVRITTTDGDVVTKVTIQNTDMMGSHIDQIAQTRVTLAAKPMGPPPPPPPPPNGGGGGLRGQNVTSQLTAQIFRWDPIYPDGIGYSDSSTYGPDNRPFAGNELAGGSSATLFGNQ